MTTTCPRCEALDKFNADAKKTTRDTAHSPTIDTFIEHWRIREQNAQKDMILLLYSPPTDFFWQLHQARACHTEKLDPYTMAIYTNLREVSNMRSNGAFKNMIWSLKPAAIPKVMYDN